MSFAEGATIATSDETHVRALVADVPTRAFMDNIRHELLTRLIDFLAPSKMMGNTSIRLQCTIGTSYRFGNTTFAAVSWEKAPMLAHLSKLIGDHYGVQFDMAHINFYPDQDGPKQAKLCWHADDEKIIDQNAPIVGISFGENMRVCFKENDNKATTDHIAHDLDIYTMSAGFQSKFQHRVAPLTKVQRIDHPFDCQFEGLRMSITLRVLKVKERHPESFVGLLIFISNEIPNWSQVRTRLF